MGFYGERYENTAYLERLWTGLFGLDTIRLVNGLLRGEVLEYRLFGEVMDSLICP